MKRYFTLQMTYQPTYVHWLHKLPDVPRTAITFVNSVRFLLENEGFNHMSWHFPDCNIYIRKDFGDKFLCRIDKLS